ncbi:Sec-independent protein translocase subunit TatA [Haloechinothrix halophila]|uniref:Sec-independent protein translocase subunit TatA n=1 Tax=Haloechinothrix halophila TaxID=1069073 RepID=UPI0004285ECA|nr:Sec-independent protein translocase subunit TatA [Haloechinothrix halophila]
MGSLSPWHLAILLAVMILLFGAKKLPDAARGLGRSLKILKAETKGLREEEDESGSRASDATSPDSKQLTDGGTSTAAQSTTDDQKVAELQQQLDELKRQQDQTHKNAS